jgi:1,4-dihydroxy-2-naphthoyl-CoA hydrolase
MKFELHRDILISDTDAAGVVFFGRYPILYHDAYELALKQHGIHLLERCREESILLPVTNLQVDYRRSLIAGDRVRIELTTTVTGEDTFDVRASIWKKIGDSEKEASRSVITHTCISSENRRRTPLPLFWRELLNGE